ncbi:Metaxin-like protein [Hapsidospora chrysogenum ATCC 11550]|uniref:Metaxin-like protein n=1 Tax=Hapsidospora chrysogenum (strain ATCC 11550 / CBS 779.69 / DSM 880 / IAM 14645 / JCM 23072 / IMI 49137) TaxID=857340 RepID=A0A086SWQ2_HAPC1|nr:Metaxin-like protein [Hapsidospora chrysogenum ATCC 11550]
MAEDSRRWFVVPAPVRALFKLFPLRIYDLEPLPYRSPDALRPRPALYIFAEHEHDGDDTDRPSFNPSCLKYQTILRIAGVDVDIVPSNNHASPSGALPFLLPPGQNARPLTGAKMLQYARDHASREIPDVSSPRLEAYRSLLTQSIRPAWLHTLYLNDQNAPLLARFYLPTSPLISLPLHHTLRAAATAEILKTTPHASTSSSPSLLPPPEHLLADARSALEALSTLLGSDDWFLGAANPGPFDAEVFAYTWLILDPHLDWRDDGLGRCLLEFENLVAHRERLYRRCWGEKAALSLDDPQVGKQQQ